MVEGERLGKEFFVSRSGDDGFYDQEVFFIMQRVMNTRRKVYGMKKILRAKLTKEGHDFAMTFIDDWIKLGLWGYLTKLAKEECLH